MITRSLDIIIVNTRVPKVPKVQNLDVPLSGCNTECGKGLNCQTAHTFGNLQQISHLSAPRHTAMSHCVTLVINGFPR